MRWRELLVVFLLAIFLCFVSTLGYCTNSDELFKGVEKALIMSKIPTNTTPPGELRKVIDKLGLTTVQFEKWKKKYIGQMVKWTGWVQDVVKREDGFGYIVKVETDAIEQISFFTDPKDDYSDVILICEEISPRKVFELRKRLKVDFTGYIEDIFLSSNYPRQYVVKVNCLSIEAATDEFLLWSLKSLKSFYQQQIYKIDDEIKRLEEIKRSLGP